MSYSRPVFNPHHYAIGTRFMPAAPYADLSASGAYPTADLAIYAPVRVFVRVLVRKLYVVNGTTVSGNIDVGIYTPSGTLIVSAGSTAQAGTSQVQLLDVTDTAIGPGIYYFAVTLDNTTGMILRDNDPAPNPAAQGVLVEQLGSGAPLPSSASWSVAQTLGYYPSVGAIIGGIL